MKYYKQSLGASGERMALEFLRRRGYRIIARNFSCRLGEIDIIARQGKTTVFVEVRTRRGTEFGLPQDSISPKKIKHLLRCAEFYIKRRGDPEGQFRFDLVGVIFGEKPQVELIKNILD